ncbi:MAG TPA: hypothetical protein VGM98_23740, partial [Schlesneria sp.]
MFHNLIQPRVQTAVESAREPVIDFAQREPQFVRLKDCVTAAVDWETVAVDQKGNRLDLMLKWEETIGSADIDVADTFELQTTKKDLPKLVSKPLQLIESFTGNVIAVQPADAAVPAYRIVSQPDESLPPKVVVQPADTYLVANSDAKIFEQHSLEIKSDASLSQIDLPGLPHAAKFVAPDLKDLLIGDVVSLFDFGDTVGLNGRQFRVISNSDNTVRILAEDTVRIVTADPIILTAPAGNVSGSFKDAGTIERPLTLHCQNDSDSVKTGVVVTVPANTVVNAHTGERVTTCICWSDGQFVTLLAPLTIDAPQNGKAKQITSVLPFFESSPRKPGVDFTTALEPSWTGALRISTSATLPEVPLDIDWVRCESAKVQEATGIFRTLPIAVGDVDLRQLVRPSIIPDLFSLTGDAIAVEGILHVFNGATPSAQTAAITKVSLSPGLPAKIEVNFNDAGLTELQSGTAILVTITKVNGVVRTGTPLDGAWVVEQFQPHQFSLFVASVAGPKGGDQKVLVSRVSPLSEAFKVPGRVAVNQKNYDLATLDPDVCNFWNEKSR